MAKENSIEVYVKQGDKAFKVTMQGEAVEEIEELQKKLGAKSVIEAIIYSVKVLSAGFEVDNGEHEVDVGGKKIRLTIGE